MSLSSREYQQAIVAGETARRAGYAQNTNPHSRDWSPNGIRLRGAWDTGWERAGKGKGRARRR